MESSLLYIILADTLLLLHGLVVLFITAGLALIYAGWAFDWSWVRNPWLRILHVAAIGVVALQSWAGVICPLTTWEMSLRNRADEAVYTGSFVSHWLTTLLFYEAPEWMFTAAYSAFGALVLASWFIVRPRSFYDS